MSNEKVNASPLLVVLSFATVYTVWGSTYFFILLALKGFTPMILGAFRFTIAGLLMLLWSLLRGEKIFNLTTIKHSAVSGILMLCGGTGVVLWVEQYLASGLVAILVSAAPIWFVIFDRPMWKDNFSSRSTLIGLIIGFIGIVLLFSEKINNFFTPGHAVEFGAMLLLIFGNWCWTLGSLNSKYKKTEGSNTVNVGWQMFVAGIVFIILSIILGEPGRMIWEYIPAVSWFSAFYLILFGSIAAYTAYVWLLQVRPSTQVSTYAYVNPVVAVLLGMLFASERISFIQILGLTVILGSVLMINLAKLKGFQNKNRR
jgi:drug/metabolite transporter (DMT)-like permease